MVVKDINTIVYANKRNFSEQVLKNWFTNAGREQKETFLAGRQILLACVF